jgi:predicted nucleic acid-binding protein
VQSEPDPLVVISDATPLHYLILIGEDGLLRELYGKVIVPAGVVRELSVAKTPQVVREWFADPPAWIDVHSVGSLDTPDFSGLGLGEREAIGLAANGPAAKSKGILLTDDLKARTAAESLGIQVVPTIRVLSTASALGLVNFDEALRKLRETNFRVSAKVIEAIRGQLLERRTKG